LPVDHYENFPVASWLLPARLRPPIEAIYAFARGADDIADEGDLSENERLRGLERYVRALDEIEAGVGQPEPPFSRLAQAVREQGLPIALLRDLIDAFTQDVTKRRYATYAELLDYSRRSANPVGRLVLHCMGSDHLVRFPRGRKQAKWSDPESLAQSDSICSALQLINFWQDIAIDWKKDRVYIPQEDMARFRVGDGHIAGQLADGSWRELMAFESRRARALLTSGWPLALSLPGRLGLEIRATIHGGAAILDKIDAAGGDVFRHRPVLGKWDWVMMVVKAVVK
jgi:squalene synthase HpnC